MFEGPQSQQPPAPEGLDLPPIFGTYSGGDCSANPFSPAAVSSFMADPFLVLDHDLDDVSEVIRHNILTDESSGSSTPSPLSNRSLAQRMSKDSEKSADQQNSEFSTSPDSFDPSKEHEIGQIVSLLQEEEPPMVQQQQFVGEQQGHNYNNNHSILEYSLGEQQLVVGAAMITNGGREGAGDPMIGGNNGLLMSPNEGQQPEGGGITVAMGEYLGDQMHQQQLDCMLMMRDNNGNQLEQYSQHYQLASLQHNYHFGTEIDPTQQQQFVGPPLALETTIPLEPQPPMVNFPEANRHIKQEIVYGGGPSDLAYHQQSTATAQFVDQQEDLEAAVAAKNELIRLLLEMSPQELEQLRAQRAAQHDLQHQQHLYHQHQHLLQALLGQLEAPEGSTLRVADFVEQYQLLLGICEADTAGGDEGEEEEDGGGKTTEENEDGRKKSKAEEDEPEMAAKLEGTENGHNGTSGGTSVLLPCLSEGDELCAWWTHLVAGGLHWRHGDSARAQKHFARVRKCPPSLAQNDLALALGFAFCTRKMCFDDRQKGKFAEMVVWHARRANAHLKRGAWTAMAGGGGRERAASLEGVVVLRGSGADQQGPQLLQCQFRLLCCQWLLSSLLDVWSFCFAHCGLVAPLEIRRLYADVLGRMEREQNANPEKLAIFRQLGKALCGMHLGQMGPLVEEEKGCPPVEKQIEIQSAAGDISDL